MCPQDGWEGGDCSSTGRSRRNRDHELMEVANKPVLLSRRFDRREKVRIPFLSAMSITGSADGERGSYPELVDALTRYGANAKADAVPSIDEWYSMFWFPMSTTICAITDSSGSARTDGRCRRPTISIRPRPISRRAS
jgi:hypothetical protein